jgi:NAD(P)-dependent dehydrogenase (short-subunit alcohol dehydrogenase family)
MTEQKQLHGKVALVTGGARGIGRAIALGLAREGADVAVADLRLEPFRGERWYRLRERWSGDDEEIPTSEAIQAEGVRACAVAMDVADEGSVGAGVAQVERELGSVDVLVNNAGIVNNIASIERMSTEAWDQEVRVNLTGGFHCVKAAVPQMAERGWGRVVNIASVAAVQPPLGQPAYAASKAAVVSFTRAVAQEFGPRGVTANAILPGLIGTPLVLSMPASIRERTVSGIPVKRLGEPADIANLAVFLASPSSGFVTATAIPCDGGWLGAPLGGLTD